MKRKRDGEIIIIFILIHPYYFNQTGYRMVQSRIFITVPTTLQVDSVFFILTESDINKPAGVRCTIPNLSFPGAFILSKKPQFVTFGVVNVGMPLRCSIKLKQIFILVFLRIPRLSAKRGPVKTSNRTFSLCRTGNRTRIDI